MLAPTRPIRAIALFTDFTAVSYYTLHPDAFSPSYLRKLQARVLACPYFAVNNLNRDFVGTKGFSLVFRRSHLSQVDAQFPWFMRYLETALRPDCNAFYLNPLGLTTGSRVDPHIDRSLRSYCKTVEPPAWVSVLYVVVPDNLQGGELLLQRQKKSVAQIRPQRNTLLWFQGDLTHSVTAVTAGGDRLSLVCEQYNLDAAQLEEIPEYTLETRATEADLARRAPPRGKRRRASTPVATALD